jgi:hypothetical protein
MALKQIPESDKSIWRQLIQNARGRGDLKQPAGFLALLVFLACCLIAARSVAGMSDAMTMTLGGIIILWWVGDTTEAVAVLMALYGKWRTPETQVTADQANISSTNTTVTPAADAPEPTPPAD